jgi:hypothetical protein
MPGLIAAASMLAAAAISPVMTAATLFSPGVV